MLQMIKKIMYPNNYQFVFERATAIELSSNFDLDSVLISSFGLLGDKTMNSLTPFLQNNIIHHKNCAVAPTPAFGNDFKGYHCR